MPTVLEYTVDLHKQAKENGLPHTFDDCLKIALNTAKDAKARRVVSPEKQEEVTK